jgi:hypothetical protein
MNMNLDMKHVLFHADVNVHAVCQCPLCVNVRAACSCHVACLFCGMLNVTED